MNEGDHDRAESGTSVHAYAGRIRSSLSYLVIQSRDPGAEHTAAQVSMPRRADASLRRIGCNLFFWLGNRSGRRPFRGVERRASSGGYGAYGKGVRDGVAVDSGAHPIRGLNTLRGQDFLRRALGDDTTVA